MKCIWCEYSSEDLNDFDEDYKHHKGVWCPCCDGFIYYPGKENFSGYKLILEKNGEETKVKPKYKFNKRLSPLRYPGGKSKLIDYLVERLDERKEIFVETFCGGASIGLALLKAGLIKKLVLNDLDYGIYSLFQIILTEPEWLIQRINEYTPNREDFFAYRNIISTDYKGVTQKEAAFALLVVNRMSYSGIVKANPKSNLTERWNDVALEKRIRWIASQRDSIKLLNMEADEVIKEYYWDGNATLFIDPPYYAKGKQLYHLYFNEEQHENIAYTLNQLFASYPGCADILITYDDEEFIKDLYPYSKVESIGRIFSIAN